MKAKATLKSESVVPWVFRVLVKPVVALLPDRRRNQMMTIAHHVKLTLFHGQVMNFDNTQKVNFDNIERPVTRTTTFPNLGCGRDAGACRD